MKGMKHAGVLAAMVVLLLALFFMKSWSRTRLVRSDITNKAYRVLDRPDAQQAADALARLELAIEDFLAKGERVVPGDKRLANIRTRWSRTFREIDGRSNIAYSMGKSDVSICVRRPDGTVHATKDSMFVVLHELTHVANDEWGHNDSFWEDFKFLLELAERTGAYTYQNLDEEPETYCGKTIASTPVFCVKRGTCKSALGPIRPASSA